MLRIEQTEKAAIVSPVVKDLQVHESYLSSGGIGCDRSKEGEWQGRRSGGRIRAAQQTDRDTDFESEMVRRYKNPRQERR